MSSRRPALGHWPPRLRLAALGLVAGLPLLMWAAPAADTVITTVVGHGSGYTGDGGPAVDAGLNGPRMVAFDGQGGYYIADTFHHAIRHVDAGGIITTYAGTGQPGYGGDGGPATQALLNAPHSVDVDDAGNLLIGDPVNNRVRRVDARTKVITTIAGTGQSGYSGDGGPATEANLNDSKVAISGPDGAVYIADYGNAVIRRVDPSTGVITTFAGNGIMASSGDGGPAREASFAPRNITFDNDGDLLVADREADAVRSIDAETGIITTIAGRGPCPSEGTECYGGDGGPALQAQLNNPRGLALDWMGHLYIADSDNNRVRRVDVDTGVMTTVAGTGESGRKGDGGPATAAQLSNPRHAIFDDAGNLYIADTGGSGIRMVSRFIPPRPAPTPPSTVATTTAEPAPSGPAASAGQRSGYWMLGDDGRVHLFGDARGYGEPAGSARPAVDLEPSPSGGGYWIVSRAGRVYSYGDARDLGGVEPGRLAAGEVVVSLSATPSGRGYWVFTSRGQALAFGDAPHVGDMAAVALSAPVLDSVPTPSGRGYWMVAGDGGIFSFGDARFYGSMGRESLNAPVQSLVPDPDGAGYWLVASDGGVFAFDAPFRGSMASVPLNRPVTGMVAYGNGYLMVGEDGGIFNFSDRPFAGSLGDRPPAHPIVSVAALPR